LNIHIQPPPPQSIKNSLKGKSIRSSRGSGNNLSINTSGDSNSGSSVNSSNSLNSMVNSSNSLNSMVNNSNSLNSMVNNSNNMDTMVNSPNNNPNPPKNNTSDYTTIGDIKNNNPTIKFDFYSSDPTYNASQLRSQENETFDFFGNNNTPTPKKTTANINLFAKDQPDLDDEDTGNRKGNFFSKSTTNVQGQTKSTGNNNNADFFC